jgi:3-hydroxyacyl-[acyl-carrier-protein] dehydratase
MKDKVKDSGTEEKTRPGELVNDYTLITRKSYLCMRMKNSLVLGDFYRILETERISDTQMSVKISLNPDHPVYKGHFPNIPIAPGVCLIQMIKEVLILTRKQNLQLEEGDNIRFLAIINPSLTPQVCIDYEFKTSDMTTERVTALIRWEGVSYLKFKGRFKTLD